MKKIIVSGLGRMGGQIAQKLHEAHFEVIVHNRSSGPIEKMGKLGFLTAYNKEEALRHFKKSERVIIWIMIPADAVEKELDDWLKIIPNGSILIDGGNSDYRKTKKQAEEVSFSGSVLMDVGTSGGVWGYKNGFSMTIGGEEKSFRSIEPVLKALSEPSGGYGYFGEPGSGHFVKMVHNAIEYGMMESLAEGYRLLKEGPYKNLDLVLAGDVWQKRSVITSWLNELTRDALKKNSGADGVEGKVAESGEARFALETAENSGIEMPAIRASFQVRIDSQKGEINFATKLLAMMRNAFGGHKINPRT